MPKRKIPKSSSEALREIRNAHVSGVPVQAEAEAEFEMFRSGVQLRKIDPALTAREYKKTGVYRFCQPGRKGAGTLDHPLAVAAARRGRDLLTQCAKLRRRPPAELAIAARKYKAQKLRADVLARLEVYASLGRKAAVVVANELDIHPDTVRRIRARHKPI
jgi:hypothetical protein